MPFPILVWGAECESRRLFASGHVGIADAPLQVQFYPGARGEDMNQSAKI
jgi:hypothetical protein